MKSQNFSYIAHPDLEAAIHKNPVDNEAWSVYGDWLQSQGDPRGELILLRMAENKGENSERVKKRTEELFQENRNSWLGPVLSDAIDEKDSLDKELTLSFERGLISEAHVRSFSHRDPEPVSIMEALWSSPLSQFLYALRVDIRSVLFDENLEQLEAAFSRQKTAPALRVLKINQFSRANARRTFVPDFSPLLDVFPNMENLDLTVGCSRLKNVRHEKLKSLKITTNAVRELPNSGILDCLSNVDFTALKSLEIDSGLSLSNDRPVSIRSLFENNNFPGLKHLTLKRVQINGNILEDLANTSMLKNLQSLHVTGAGIDDFTAYTLIEKADAYKHLEKLEIQNHLLSNAMNGRLEKAFPDRIC